MRTAVLMSIAILLFPMIYLCGSSADSLHLMPIPEKIQMREGKFRVTDEFTAAIQLGKLNKNKSNRANRALRRMLNRLAGRTGIFFKEYKIITKKKINATSLKLIFSKEGEVKLGVDESYLLDIDGEKGLTLSAVTDIGIIRGLETLLQLLQADSEGYYFPALTVEDKPRFPWRGLLIDSCRHFMPIEVIKRNLDGMAAVKLNVLHWHLSEDQGFRVECKTYPKLHELGSDGLYYTHAQIREIVAYASDRGIRVMPEFDIPGHSTSWLVAYPQYGSGPAPKEIERKYGIFDPTFDPTRRGTFKFFRRFFKEMAQLFPDEYFHIGGDENNGKEWDASPRIKEFKEEKEYKSNHEVQAYFNRQILRFLDRFDKKMVGWDEIFQPELPDTIVIQSWRGKESMIKAAQRGIRSLLSNGYYIDLCQTTAFHYLNDPIPEDTPLTPKQQKLILGGEATMWSELVSPETVDSRIWPRTAAIAERFWSPGSVKDVDWMYRRLTTISLQLEELGLTHIKNREMLLRRLCRGMNTTPLRTLVSVMEPVKKYERHNQGVTYTFFSPLTRVVDAAQPDSVNARLFDMKVDDFLKNPGNKSKGETLELALNVWKNNHKKLQPVIRQSPVLKEIESLSQDLFKVSVIGTECIKQISAGKRIPQKLAQDYLKLLEAAKKPRGHAELMIVASIEKLVKRAANLK